MKVFLTLYFLISLAAPSVFANDLGPRSPISQSCRLSLTSLGFGDAFVAIFHDLAEFMVQMRNTSAESASSVMMESQYLQKNQEMESLLGPNFSTEIKEELSRILKKEIALLAGESDAEGDVKSSAEIIARAIEVRGSMEESIRILRSKLWDVMREKDEELFRMNANGSILQSGKITRVMQESERRYSLIDDEIKTKEAVLESANLDLVRENIKLKLREFQKLPSTPEEDEMIQSTLYGVNELDAKNAEHVLNRLNILYGKLSLIRGRKK